MLWQTMKRCISGIGGSDLGFASRWLADLMHRRIMKRLHKPEVVLSCSPVSGIIQQVAQEVQLGISAMIRGDGAYVATEGTFVDLLRSR